MSGRFRSGRPCRRFASEASCSVLLRHLPLDNRTASCAAAPTTAPSNPAILPSRRPTPALHVPPRVHRATLPPANAVLLCVPPTFNGVHPVLHMHHISIIKGTANVEDAVHR